MTQLLKRLSAVLFVAIVALSSNDTAALAVARGRIVFIGGYFYDTAFGPYPWWSSAAYPYDYYPVVGRPADVRVQVTPADAAVYVDGYYAGLAREFSGLSTRLPLSPDDHDLVLFLEGYRTSRQHLSLPQGTTFKLQVTMERLPAGERSELPRVVPPVPLPPPGSATRPRPQLARFAWPGTAPERSPVPISGPVPTAVPPPATPASSAPPQTPDADDIGTLSIRVQPLGAEIIIDGQPLGIVGRDVRLVQVAQGQHHLEVRKNGYRAFVTDIQVGVRETVPLIVSLVLEPPQ